LECCKGAIII